MIHIATVHWKTDKWIDIQLRYIKEHIRSEYRVYAFLNDVSEDHDHKFYYVNKEPIESHAIKLNILAEIIALSGEQDDILLFFDGDAFPISNDLENFLQREVSSHRLIAIQRSENFRDVQPHPSFCATTVGFWRFLKGDWKMGYLWKDQRGIKVTDVGGNLLERLNLLEVDWLPLHRTNKHNLHPVMFGIYENIVYHHGSGFKEPYERIDRKKGGIQRELVYRLALFLNSLAAFLKRKLVRKQRIIIQENSTLERRVFDKILNRSDFYKELI